MKNKNNLKELLQVKNQTETSAELYIYGEIVCDSWSKWIEEDKYPLEIKSFLDGAKGKDLNIYINSGGGSVFAGMAIYNMLKRHDGFKTVHIDGVAASIASVIALAGDKIIMPSNAYFMIHKPLVCVCGNANELLEYCEILDKLEEGIISVYMDNVKDGVDEKTIKNFIQKETWFTGKEAAQYFDFEVIQELAAVAFAGNNFNNFKNAPKIASEQAEASTFENQNEKTKCNTKLRLLSLKGANK